MKIREIKINNFGNLENKEINLNNKINIIYGKNESGKSTLLNYIKNIFYGISKNKNGKEISDYEKYKPWMKEEFSGKMKYELDDGKIFEVFRDFNKKNPKVFNGNIEEISNEFNIDKKDGIQFFYEQTNVDETMFLSTVVSMQQEVKLDKQEQNILVQKIANLAGTGDDNVSFKKTMDKLSKKQLDEIGTDRTQEKPINIVKKRMRDISFVIKDINSCKEQLKNLKEKRTKILEENSKLNIQNNILKKLNEFNLEKNIENEKIKIKNKIKNENEEKINKLNKEREDLNYLIKNKKININNKKDLLENKEINNIKRKNKKNKEINKNKNKRYLIITMCIIILSTILKILNEVYLRKELLNYIIYTILPIYLIYVIINIQFKRNKTKKKEYEEKLKEELENEKYKLEQEKINNEITLLEKQIESIDKQIVDIFNENKKQESEINILQSDLENKLDFIIEQVRKKYIDQIDVDNFLDNLILEKIDNYIINIQEKINQNNILLKELEISQKGFEENLENIITQKEEYNLLEEELKELEEKNMCINLTKEYLNKAYEEMKNNVTPKFTENLSKNISEISNSKYQKVIINEDKGLIVENEYGDYISAERLSIGTIDQLYLSLRLSMIDELSNENMPIILDEAFAYYDDIRLKNIIEFLLKRSDKNQVIIFTCTKREQEILNKLGVQYNLVEL